MRKISFLTLMIFTLIVSILLIGVQKSMAEANEVKLNGTYAFNVILTCSPGSTIIHLQGLLTFDGNGGGESEYTSLFLPAEFGALSESFEYTVDEYNYFTIVQDITLDNGMFIENSVDEGWIGHGGQTLVISSNSKLEHVTTDTTEFDRWCVRSGTAVKVPKL